VRAVSLSAEKIRQAKGLADDDVTALGFGYDGLLWFGTYDSGLSARAEAPELIFADGFESGDFGAWSAEAP